MKAPPEPSPAPGDRETPRRRTRTNVPPASADLYRLLVESVQDYAIFALDADGYILSWNPGAERFKGYRAEEILGRHFSVFYPRELVAEGYPDFELRMAANTGRYEDEGWRIRKDGSRFWANVVISALRNAQGELTGFAKVTRDLTERRAAERRANDAAARVAAEEAARRRADEANSAKSQFLAAMSHELRTPLNAIGGYSDLIAMGLAGPVTELQLEHLGRIKRSQAHLLGIINDILNFSRVEAGHVSYDLGPIRVHEVVSSAMLMVAPQAHARGIRLEEPDCDASLVAWADRAKVDQIVLNLVSNAVKFTSAGGTIRLSCGRFDAERVAIRVDDTGCGIPEQQLETIFEPFVQVGRSLTDTRDGTGLGLAISRDLARAMRGDIVVKSTVDEGSEFSLLLPTQAQR